jgi:hypothetical protein
MCMDGTVEIKIGQMPDETEDKAARAVGTLLSDLSSFKLVVSESRNKLGISVFTPPGSVSVFDEAVSIMGNMTAEERHELEREAAGIAISYRLSENWNIPIEILLLTNHFLIPNDPPIDLRSPKAWKTLEDAGADLQERRKEVAIFPSYRVSITELVRYIEQNSDAIKSAMSNLPSKPFNHMHPHTFLQGQMAYLARADGMSWKDVASKVNTITESMGGVKSQLTYITARNAAIRYKNQLDILDTK